MLAKTIAAALVATLAIAPAVRSEETVATTKAPLTLGGTLEIYDQDLDSRSEFCIARDGRSGYDDLLRGFSVTVRNGKNEVISTFAVEPGSFAIEKEILRKCVVTLPEVALPVASFYSFEMGSRKPITYSYDQLKERDGQLKLSIGL